ncbi:hypothetical protein POM88_048309 [Heracleum sosnowskyi]|uniref:Protein kinase domain-containing protein n=1 Tax=Heracleum sosnowskyi TaxID=360622 RepID=A0AAD8M0H5_9APIA|nr:hypothetical protein POM88_048309 [Heracleum sosnowskyi]
MDKYEVLKNIGAGSYGLTMLMRNKITKELVAVKFIQRDKINENVEREIINHRSLEHPNIVRFMEVLLTPADIVIVMEYAAGGELYDRIITAKRLGEDESRYFFQQLISGVSYCHYMRICHRDLKLANILLDGSSMPILKICDSGFSKSSLFPSAPNSAVGTLAYIPPELIHPHNEYDGKLADVWSCGVTLYFMLVGKYPFSDQEDPANWSQIMQRILGVQYKIPDSVDISEDCRHLLSRIFVAPASRRITIEEIKNHPWFLKNLPWKESEAAPRIYCRKEISAISPQSVESIMEIVGEASQPTMNSFPVFSSVGGFIRTKAENDNDKEQILKKDYQDRQAEEKLVSPELYTSHARKRSRDTSEGRPGFMNPASMEIAIRYANILDLNQNYFIQHGNYEHMIKLMEWWIHASVPEDYKPKKNRCIGLFRVPATQLLIDLAAGYYSEGSESSSSAATGRADPSSIPDIVFVQVVRQVLQNAQDNLPMYSTPPSYERVTTLARTALQNVDSRSQSTFTFSSDIIGEVIILVGNILADIFEKYEARTQKLQVSALANEDLEDDTADMDEDTDDTGNVPRMLIRSIHNGNGIKDRWIHDFGDEF